MVELETKVAVIQGDIARQNVVIGKIETMIEKLGEVSNSVAKLLAVHEERLSQHQETHAELFSVVETHKNGIQADVKDLHSRITTVQRELSSNIAEVERSLKEALKTGLGEIKTAITNETATIEKDHEQRIRSLERSKWLLAGGAAVAGAFARDIVSMILK